MNLNQLKIFYLAAKDIYITQPAVTKAIQRIQEYYKSSLSIALVKNWR